jgi:prepilin-type N-terminal cleavage/methylation domain-containing protein
MTSFTKRGLPVRLFHSAPHGRRKGGFTLIELLIVIAIAAILAAVAVPSFRTMNRNMAVRGAADELVADIQFARSEAVRTNRVVSLLLNGRTWQIFIDSNGNRIRDNDEDVLREGSYSDLIEESDSLWLGFSPTGTISLAAGDFPKSICLSIVGDSSIERQVLFPTRATSPVIQTGCP